MLYISHSVIKNITKMNESCIIGNLCKCKKYLFPIHKEQKKIVGKNAQDENLML